MGLGRSQTGQLLASCVFFASEQSGLGGKSWTHQENRQCALPSPVSLTLLLEESHKEMRQFHREVRLQFRAFGPATIWVSMFSCQHLHPKA